MRREAPRGKINPRLDHLSVSRPTFSNPEKPIANPQAYWEAPNMQRVDRSLLKTAPKGPGVYFMYGENGSLLYVGKAKSLRKRLSSYWRVVSGESRKLERMRRWTKRIEWQETESEKAALLLENSLLREHRPFFNVMNTRPESYPYLVLRKGNPVGGYVFCRLFASRSQDTDRPTDTIYGAFRSKRLPRLAAQTIFRLMGEKRVRSEKSEDARPQKRGWIHLTTSELATLKSFLKGTRSAFVSEIYGQLWDLGCFEDPLIAKQLDHDFNLLRVFFEYCPKLNLKIKRGLGLDSSFIEQDKLDDHIVEMNFKH